MLVLSYYGFCIFFSQVPCNGSFYEDYGILESPNFPNSYPRNFLCEWTITVPQGRIGILITDLNVEYDSQCDYDVLQVSGKFRLKLHN